eukprot:gb/GEZJ01006299.1/.p1 GENE.gb/GEZJ01006299.1/~~gb/GEZJ01006299.1/.p1  ORF type:complete len:106 (-),score=12.45 gb/GEZJ01006299.1/:216-533(-)
MMPPGMAIMGDSAFVNNTNYIKGKIVKARKTNVTNYISESQELVAVDIKLHRIMPSERKSAGWQKELSRGHLKNQKNTHNRRKDMQYPRRTGCAFIQIPHSPNGA